MTLNGLREVLCDEEEMGQKGNDCTNRSNGPPSENQRAIHRKQRRATVTMGRMKRCITAIVGLMSFSRTKYFLIWPSFFSLVRSFWSTRVL
jgi:hypothetical protein